MQTPFFNMSQPRTGIAAVVNQIPPRSVLLSEAETLYRESVCTVCDKNVDWICEHVGCLPCKQRSAGGLKMCLRLATFHCPMGKFR
jgi:hypothetical protein